MTPEKEAAAKSKWEQIIQLHNCTKALILYAEELDPGHSFFWPPLIQQRDALDHIVRAQAELLRPEGVLEGKSANSEDYVIAQLDKALGHAYRAFFDAADWYSIIMRESIGSIVSEYSRRVVTRVVPDYVQIESRVAAICKEIGKLRTAKDIARNGLLPDVKTYTGIIDELAMMLDKLRKAVPDLDKAEYGEARG